MRSPDRHTPRTVASASRVVSFESGRLTLRGHLAEPRGAGPFAAIVWNHGSERDPGPRMALADFYTSTGYVFFAPHRRGHGLSPGPWEMEQLPAQARGQAQDPDEYRATVMRLVIELHEAHLRDTLAAVRWLGQRRSVDPTRMAMSGASHGGIQTLLAAEAGAEAAAYVPFAPAATAWRGNPEWHDRLLRAVQRAAAPVFLLQAANDHDLGPSRFLGEALRRKRPPNQARVYPPYGATPQEGHASFATEGTDVWGDDVRRFLEAALGSPPERAAPRAASS